MTSKQRTTADPASKISEEELLLSTAPDDWEFETVIEETPAQIKLDIGDSVILQFIEILHVDNPNKREDNDEEDFDLLVFRGRNGKPYSINPSFKLARDWGKIQPQDWVRITLVGELPSKKGNPLKDYKVERAVRKT